MYIYAAVTLALNTSSDPKKGAFGFFALKNMKFWEKA